MYEIYVYVCVCVRSISCYSRVTLTKTLRLQFSSILLGMGNGHPRQPAVSLQMHSAMPTRFILSKRPYWPGDSGVPGMGTGEEGDFHVPIAYPKLEPQGNSTQQPVFSAEPLPFVSPRSKSS